MNFAEMLKNELSQGKFWTDAWSLVEGCMPVSPGCANCWLAGMEHRFGRHKDRDCLVDADGIFTGAIRLRDDRLELPLRARKSRVYAIWSDLFHGAVPREFILKAFATIARAKQHHFVIVTKRPYVAAEQLGKNGSLFPNVTILVTMEDQLRADERIPAAIDLAQKGWRVGALCEPLLGPISFGNYFEKDAWLKFFRWLITGGESGSDARPCHPDWVRSLRDQAQDSITPFMFKQWGEWAPSDVVKGGLPFYKWREFPEGCVESRPIRIHGMIAAEPVVIVGRAGKKNAGRILDGREWLEVPHG